jgi:hypothetical protein
MTNADITRSILEILPKGEKVNVRSKLFDDSRAYTMEYVKLEGDVLTLRCQYRSQLYYIPYTKEEDDSFCVVVNIQVYNVEHPAIEAALACKGKCPTCEAGRYPLEPSYTCYACSREKEKVQKIHYGE